MFTQTVQKPLLFGLLDRGGGGGGSRPLSSMGRSLAGSCACAGESVGGMTMRLFGRDLDLGLSGVPFI